MKKQTNLSKQLEETEIPKNAEIDKIIDNETEQSLLDEESFDGKMLRFGV